MSNRNATGFDSLRLEGGLLSPTLLQKARHYDLPGQAPGDYGIDRGLRFNDELGRYWRIAAARWETFDALRQRRDQDPERLALGEWLRPLLERVLGYELRPLLRPRAIGERRFPITHTACGGAVTLVLVGPDQPLDRGVARFGGEGRRRSPHGLAQEYLNAESASLWAIVSNGLTLRLLRDNPAMTRPAYLEFDLQRLFGEQNFVDFTLFWLLLHHTRLQPRDRHPESCWLEQWRSQGQSDGERVLGELRVGVTQALRVLGTGFAGHPGNDPLRAAIRAGELDRDAFFQELLRLVYRFLFLFTAEDRELLPDPAAAAPARDLYRQGYGLGQLRERARFRRYQTAHGDAWEQLLITFRGFARGEPALAQPALGGLFAADQCPHLEQAALANHHLYQALFHLGWFESGRTLVRINYRDMDTEELGSVYESLLELVPELRTEGRWSFGFLGDEPGYTGDGAGQGNARKLSGSYYTPDSLVQELVRTALEPVIRQRLAARPEEPRATLLGITVCDPACGSGHFLLAAARRLAAELARIQAGADQPTEADYRHALREVVRHCIYGVDINPLAVELCKTALWLETLEPGRPLGFLDAHIQCGNALVGLFDPGLLRQGIPAAAYRPLTGDDRKSCAALKKRNRIDRRQRQLLTGHQAPPAVCAGDLLAMPEEELDQIERKRAAWAALVQGPACRDERQRADLFTAAFFAPKTPQTAERVPTSVELAALEAGDPLPGGMAEQVSALARQHRFFHWYLAFPEVLERGGFAVMLGNPPWERIKLQEKEFFASRSPAIASAPNAAARNRKIQALRQGSPVEQALYAAFMVARQGAEAASIFVRGSGRFPLTGTGDVNLYALFAEHFAHGIGAEGRAGMIVPTGIATDDSTKAFFGAITGGNRLVSLFDFENREAIFPGVHRSYKFSLLTLGRPGGAAELAFFATRPEQLRDPERRFSLTPAEFALINPNTRTCPVFRARRDAELTRKLYRAAPVLIREATRDGPEPNPWGIRFSRLFDMSNDSGLFRSHEQLDGETSGLLPLYEAKMVHQYDHRWATYETDGRTSRNCTLAEKRDPAFEPRPRYWVEAWQVTLRTARAPAGLLKAARSGDGDALITVLAEWAAGHALAQGDPATARRLLGRLPGMAEMPPLRDAGGPTPHAAALQRQAEAWPLTREEARALDRSLTDGDDPWPVARRLLEARRPGYLLGWRDICRSTDERTVIAGVIPLAAVGDTFLLMFPEVTDQRLVACLLADQCSLVHDFVARQKIGGTHLKYHMKKQITTLAPDQYTEDDLDYIVPRVLELSYTSHALAPFARDLGCHGDPFPYDLERRHRLKCELDARYARLYGLTRDELRYILNPAEVMGDDYPSETFRVLRKNELEQYGEYRTRRLVLAAWDGLE